MNLFSAWAADTGQRFSGSDSRVASGNGVRYRRYRTLLTRIEETMADYHDAAPQPIYLKDYQPPAFQIDTIDLVFELGEAVTRVVSRIVGRRERGGTELVLDGGATLVLRSVKSGDRLLVEGQDYCATSTSLTVLGIGSGFDLTIETEIKPQENTELYGLYKSSGMFCTQCEAEGFRRITYYLDRPDILARFTTTLIADRARYPVLLSNGNCIEARDLGDGRHLARWQDPFPKPAYLFALVAGELSCLEDHFTTRSGREVVLQIFATAADIDKCRHAMDALKRSMAWDEKVYGLEYDLDIFMIVAVGDFTMGAMENKGLNIFNTKFVLANPETATDTDFFNIESVIAHEYFHNWTGNRVTCRDWFQLTLKEGLTVFRDQQYSADLGSAAVTRIAEVRKLRQGQFPEDAGPMAHPIRPDSYIEINNFYTATVYLKGAEVIRMIHTLLGADRFRKGMDLYFQRHDGKAVTCDDFVDAMQDASDLDLSQFRRWYSQSGTPEITIEQVYDSADQSLRLTVSQSTPPTARQPDKTALHIPLSIGLIGADGSPIAVQLAGENDVVPGTRTLDLVGPRQEFHLVNVPTPPKLSLLRGFSAPVKLASRLPDEDLFFLMAHDEDLFARWEAGQQAAVRQLQTLSAAYQSGRDLVAGAAYLAAMETLLQDEKLDQAFLAEMITLPSETYVAEMAETPDPDAIHAAREFLRQAVGQASSGTLRRRYESAIDLGEFSVSPAAVGRRALKNAVLDYLVAAGGQGAVALLQAQLAGARNMTDQLAALRLLASTDAPSRQSSLDAFAEQWKDEALVLDKWFMIQAGSSRADTLDRVIALTKHPAFDLKIPNKVRALIEEFANGNPVRFHDPSGAGYRFAADFVLALNAITPKVAARLLGSLINWRRYDERRQILMKDELERVIAAPSLSPDVYEVVSKALSRA